MSGALGHRPPPYLRHPGPPERRRHQDGVRHSGPLRRRIYPAGLHPHYSPETGRGSPDHGQPHGAGEITTSKESKTAHRAGTSLPVRCVFSPVPKGHELAVTGKAANCQPMWVTVWVRFFHSLEVITFCIAKHPENNRFRGVLCVSDTI